MLSFLILFVWLHSGGIGDHLRLSQNFLSRVVRFRLLVVWFGFHSLRSVMLLLYKPLHLTHSSIHKSTYSSLHLPSRVDSALIWISPLARVIFWVFFILAICVRISLPTAIRSPLPATCFNESFYCRLNAFLDFIAIIACIIDLFHQISVFRLHIWLKCSFKITYFSNL